MTARAHASQDTTLTPEVQAAQRRTDDLAATMKGWFWETDADLRFTYMSPNVEVITGVSPDWHYGKTRADLGCPASISQAEWDQHLATMDAREPFVDFVFLRKGPKGDTWLRTSGNPCYGPDGTYLGYRGSAADVSDEMEARQRAICLSAAMEDKTRILETALRTIPDGVLVLDKAMDIVACNDQLFEVLEVDRAPLMAGRAPGRALLATMARRGDLGPGEVDELLARRDQIIRDGELIHYDIQLESGAWIECRGNPIAGGSYMVVYRDVTENRQMIKALEQQAATDPLTGALNRRKFMEIADGEFARARRYGRPLSFVMLDLDHFKAINDTYGHASGDLALQQLVVTASDNLRETDRIGRFGGEEFLLMLPETDAEGAYIVAERLRAAIEETLLGVDGVTFGVTLSAGVAQAGSAHQGTPDVIASADQAMYLAKGAGRNQVMCWAEPPQEDLAAAFGG